MDFAPATAFVGIVDDDESTRTAICALLHAAGFRARAFASAQEFLDSTEFSSCACLIADVQMPGFSGIELQQRLADMGAKIPLMFVSAYGDDALRQRVVERGALGFLDKPFDDTVLLALVGKALARGTGTDA